MAVVPPALVGDPETYAVSFFMSTYANPSISNDERKDFLDYVAPQYVEAGPDSVLRMATMAMSTFLFVAWLDRRPDTVLSRSFYLKALSTLKERIASPEGCADNDVLTTVMLLQLYEVLISRYSPKDRETNVEKRLLGVVNQSKPGRAHLEGALALINHRGVENFKDEVGQGLLFAVRSQLVGLIHLEHMKIVLTWMHRLKNRSSQANNYPTMYQHGRITVLEHQVLN